MTRTLLFLLVSVSAFAATDPIDPARLIYGGTWQNRVGVSGGIPNRTTVFSNAPAGASAAVVNSILAACTSNQVVAMPAGTNSFNADITINANGVTLRGATNADGTRATWFNWSTKNGIIVGSDSGWDTSDPTKFTTINVSSGATRGSTSVVVASTPTGLSAGMIMWFSAASSAAVRGSGFSDWLGTRPGIQTVTVTNVSGTTVEFFPEFSPDYWTGTIQVSYRGASDTRHLSGIENIGMMFNGGSMSMSNHFVKFIGTDQCWMKNCSTYWAAHGSYHVYLYANHRTEIRDCDISKAELGSDASSTYCITVQDSGALWIENNWFYNVANVMPCFGMSGSVFSYNYINDLPYSTGSPDWLSQIVYFHGSHSCYNLCEGNWCAAHFNDHTPGSKNNVYFRERGRGWDATPSPNGKQSNASYMNEDAVGEGTSYHENMVIAGSVLGETNSVFHHTAWSNSVSGNPVLGIKPTSYASLVITNTYAVVSNAILFPLTGGQALPLSYIYDSKPLWAGDRVWPMVEPTNTALSLESYTSTNLAAGYRALFGTNPPTSAPLVAVTLLPIGGARLRLPR